jgi:TRAP-type mannitol/chloroaromatic compound transport system permease small subunit
VNFLAGFVRAIDRLNDLVGRGVAWLTLAMVLITFAVVILRYVFSLGWVWMQESYVWLHGIVFMLGAGYTLLHNGHVRVDIFYRPASARHKAWVDLFGVCVLLLPLVAVSMVFSWEYVVKSWAGLEESREAGGLPGLYLLKSIIWCFCLLVALQALSLAGRSILVLSGNEDVSAQGETEGMGGGI